MHGKGYSQLRKGRWSGRNQIYHLMFVTASRVPLFADFYLARTVVRAMQRESNRQHVGSLAYTVMPDHCHWLIRLGDVKPLSIVINNVKSRSAREINCYSGSAGRVWQRGFFDRAIRREEDIVTIARYIVANPLRAGLVRSLADYPHWDSKWV